MLPTELFDHPSVAKTTLLKYQVDLSTLFNFFWTFPHFPSILILSVGVYTTKISKT